jgi:CHASE3 domain sensor protein
MKARTMNDKVKNWIILIALILLLIGVFFAGRSCGSSQQRKLVREIKTQLASSLEGQRKLTEALERERGFVDTLESINRRLVRRVADLQESVDSGYKRLEKRIEGQREFIERITTLNGLSRDATQSIGNGLTESLKLVNRLFKKPNTEDD